MKTDIPDEKRVIRAALVTAWWSVAVLGVIAVQGISATANAAEGGVAAPRLAYAATPSALRSARTNRSAIGRDGPGRLENPKQNSKQNPTRLLFSADDDPPPNLFSGVYETGESGTLAIQRLAIQSRASALAWQGSNNYVGFWHSPALDLSNLERIELKLEGKVAPGACVDVRVEDVVPGQETGRIYRSECLELRPRSSTFVLTADDFSRFPHFGEQDGALDWSRIKNIQIQTGPEPADYEPYYGAYHHREWGAITKLGGDGAFVWHGNRCYFGFSFRESIDLTQLKEVRANLSGGGEVDLHLIDDNDVSYYVADVDLDRGLRIHRFTKDDFKLFPYREIGVLDWENIRKIQWQIPDSEGARVAMERLEVALHDGRSYSIASSSGSSTSVALREIAVIVDDSRPPRLHRERRLAHPSTATGP